MSNYNPTQKNLLLAQEFSRQASHRLRAAWSANEDCDESDKDLRRELDILLRDAEQLDAKIYKCRQDYDDKMSELPY